MLPCEENCIIFGDFNSPTTRWGYNTTTSAGKNAEDFVDSNPVERIPSSKPNYFTFLNTRGSKSSPDLVFAHINSAQNVKQSSIALIGCHGHKVIKVTLEDSAKFEQKTKSFVSWNLKKANWSAIDPKIRSDATMC